MRRILRTVRVPERLDNDIEELRELNSSTYTEALILLLSCGSKVESYRGSLDDPDVRKQIDEEFRQLTYEGHVFEQLSMFSKTQLDALKSALKMEEERRYGAKQEFDTY